LSGGVWRETFPVWEMFGLNVRFMARAWSESRLFLGIALRNCGLLRVLRRVLIDRFAVCLV
jgi:hypothetical protein